MPCPPPHRWPSTARAIPCRSLLWLTILVIAGCRTPPPVESEYGQRQGESAGRSLNGTSVLAHMFEQSGRRVRTARRFDRLDRRADAILWFPDQRAAPSPAAQQAIEQWLSEKDGRLLVLVGRDFDARFPFWEQALRSARGQQWWEIRRQMARHRAEQDLKRSQLPRDEATPWFVIQRGQPAQRLGSLQGPWSSGISAEAADLRLTTRWRFPDAPATPDATAKAAPREMSTPAPDGTVTTVAWPRTDPSRGTWHGATWLASKGDLLVGQLRRSDWKRSRLILVTNGSWLLNYPLLNHEHRKLAGRLIHECGSASDVVFLESGSGDLLLPDPQANRHHGLEAFTVWPINCILMHLTIVGVMVLFWVFPIFGRPRVVADASRSDFGQHVRALGQLLARTEDAAFARKARSEFLQRVSGESTRGRDVLPPHPPPTPAKPRETRRGYGPV